MANITLAGTLRDPNGDLAVGDKVRFTHKSTTGETVKSASSILTIDPTGVYSVDLEYGLVLVEYKDARNAQFENLGVATVNGDNPATTIPELLNALVPVSSAELIEFQAILADCVAAQVAAEAAAATLDLINDLSQAYIFDTVALFKSSAIVFPDGKTIHLNDRDAYFVKITGTGTGNDANIIASTSANQSLQLKSTTKTHNVRWFGAYKDGTNTALNTTAIQFSIDYCALNGLSLEDEKGEYSITSLRVKNGIKSINLTNGKLLPTNATDPDNLHDAVIILAGVNTGEASGVDNADISFNIDMSAGDRMAIVGDGVTNSRIKNNKIYGFTDNATKNHRGIRLANESNSNVIYHNKLEGYDDPIQRGLLLEVIGESTDSTALFGGFFRGLIKRADLPCLYNVIYANEMINGSYALNIQFTEKSVFSKNICKGQNHRSIFAGNSIWNNLFDDNQFLSFRSSGILLSYGSSYNTVSNNVFKNEGAEGFSGEACVNIQTGSSNNLITGNQIDAPMNYSIYMATDSSRNTAKNNKCTNFVIAAIAVENDWIDTPPVGANYSRPNYADPTALDPPFSSSWTYNGITDNVIENNTINSGYTGRQAAGVYISQITNDLAGATETSTRNITVKGNTFTTVDNMGPMLSIFKDTGTMNGLRISGNTFNDNVLKSDFLISGANYYDVISYIGNNELFDDLVRSTPVSFTDQDTTPSVIDLLKTDHFKCVNTVATNITTFDDSFEGQIIRVRLDSFTVLVHNSGVLRLQGNVNVNGTSNVFMKFQKLGSIWLEIDRNF